MALSTILFAPLLLEFRTKAPGAATYPLFIRKRFGDAAHIMALVACIGTAIYRGVTALTCKRKTSFILA